LEEAARNQWSSNEAENQLVKVLQEDFLDTVQEMGGTALVLDLREELQKIRQRGDKIPPWLTQWVEKSPSARIPVHRLSIRTADVENSRGTRGQMESIDGNLELLETLCQQVEDLLQLPQGLLLVREEEDLSMTFLPPDMLLKAIGGQFGSRAAVPVATVAQSSLRELVQMVKNHQRPHLISRFHQELEGRKQVHPYPAWFHDIYHLLTMSSLSEASWEGALTFLEIFEEMDLIHEKNSELGVVLDGLLIEPDPGFKDMFIEMNAGILNDPVLVENFYDKLKIKLKSNPNRLLILAQFESVFSEKLGMGNWDTVPPSNASPANQN
jgi:hypothetical protein